MAENENPNIKQARNMSRPSFLRRLYFWRDSIVLQLLIPALALVVTFLCVQVVFIIEENNPRHISGEQCKFPGLEAHYETNDGKPVQVVSVESQWRMTGGGDAPSLLETGKGSDEFEIYLPEGGYSIAY